MIARMVALLSRSRHVVLALVLLGLVCALSAAPRQIPLGFNFVNAEVATVIKSLADASGANIVVGPEVKGTITLKLNGVTLEQALQIIADMTGCTYHTTDGVYFISKATEVKPETPTKVNAYSIVKLQITKPEDVIAALSVAYADVQVKAMPDNRLVLSGDEARLAGAKAFIAEIDKPQTNTANGETVETKYTVQCIVPWQAKAYVEGLFTGQGLSITYAPANSWLDGSAIGADTTGSVTGNTSTIPSAQGWTSNELVIRGPKTIVEQAVAGLQKIDQRAPMTEKRCAVKRIYPSQAITYLLGQYETRGLMVVTAPMTCLPSADKSAATGNTQIGTRVIRAKDGKLNVGEPIGDFILMGSPDVVTDALATLEKIDVGPERAERIYTLRFLQVSEAKDQLLQLYGADGLQVFVAPSKRGDTPDVVSSDSGGSVGGSAPVTGAAALVKVFDLVLRGPDDVVVRAEQLLDRLDTESAQISIKAQIISINADDTKQLGIEWPSSISTTATEVPSGDVLRLGRITRTPISFDATINMLESQNRAKTISEPSTVVQNGRQALIHVGNKVSYETVSSISNGTPVYSTVQSDTGVTLQVLPQMSKDGIITLQISTSVSELTGFTKGASGAELPQFKDTSASTVVQVRDGDILVIGGLTQNGNSIETKSVPVLGKLPLLGGLFSSKTTRPSNSELMIIVTPSMVKNTFKAIETPAPALPTTEK